MNGRLPRIATVLSASLLVVAVGILELPSALAADATKLLAEGRELFTREWLAGDQRSAGGDGLGPMFNETSCVGCHNQGGLGGGGPESKNVEMLTVVALSDGSGRGDENSSDEGGLIASTLEVPAKREPVPKDAKEQKAKLAALHPDFSSARSIVLHRHSLDPAYYEWRKRFQSTDRFFFGGGVSEFGDEDLTGAEQLLGIPTGNRGSSKSKDAVAKAALDLRNMGIALERIRGIAQRSSRTARSSADVDGFVFVVSPRNTSALFGTGLIDTISEETLSAVAKGDPAFPEVTGRVARLKDGRSGRFGWKAQQATLRDFTLTACAVELGLSVPDHDQARVPDQKTDVEPKLDMSPTECDSLVAFVSSLPRPTQRTASRQEAKALSAGERHFQAVGCAACHVAKLGEVGGLYADLLLHDMGVDLADSGAYGGPAPNSSEDVEEPLPLLASNRPRREPTDKDLAKSTGALRQEWRTPPLWGCRDSAPYLHDGRAATLEEAIAFHGGEARLTTVRFFALEDTQRLEVLAFLKSLVAPGL